ncbi:TPM domain-containing protein [Chryseolinea lacunae]|uniref:TPM domain-containing protein n=1 Tax=Chryseolinea lacunae TaxID=2801331 RepID=A0ABS1KTM2_9BACT|nr:TPM domain-containing protein [Chryseolinea lacunae]MBL0742572.1 TPM domain-containing protein [Chryseolinea lacunae]
MKTLRTLALFSGSILFLFSCGKSSDITIANRIFDEAHVLSDVQKDSLITMIRNIDENLGPQIAVMTVVDTHGEMVDHYSLKKVRELGLGRKDMNDGVLLLVSTKGHAARIEVGTGLERVLDEDLCLSIIWEMAPKFTAERYGEGLIRGLDKVRGVLMVNKERIGKK